MPKLQPVDNEEKLTKELHQTNQDIRALVRQLQREGVDFEPPQPQKPEIVHPVPPKPEKPACPPPSSNPPRTPPKTGGGVGRSLNIGDKRKRGKYEEIFTGLDEDGNEEWEPIGNADGTPFGSDKPKDKGKPKSKASDAEKIKPEEDTDDVGRTKSRTSNTALLGELKKVVSGISHLNEVMEVVAEHLTGGHGASISGLAHSEHESEEKHEASAEPQRTVFSKMLGFLEKIWHSSERQEKFLEAQLDKQDAARISKEEIRQDATPANDNAPKVSPKPSNDKKESGGSSAISGLFGGLAAGLLGGLGKLILAPEQLALKVVGLIGDGIMGLFRGFFKILPGLAKSNIVKVLGKAAFWLDMIAGLFEGVTDAIAEYKKSGSVTESVISFVTSFLKSITFGLIDKETFAKAYNSAEEIVQKYLIEPFQDIWDDLSSKFKKVWTHVGDAYDDVVTGAKRMFEDIGDWWGNAFKHIGNGFKSCLAGFMETLAKIEIPAFKIPNPFGKDWTVGPFKPFSGLADGAKNLHNEVDKSEASMESGLVDKSVLRAEEDTATAKARQNRDEQADIDHADQLGKRQEDRLIADSARHNAQADRVESAKATDAESLSDRMGDAYGKDVQKKVDKATDAVVESVKETAKGVSDAALQTGQGGGSIMPKTQKISEMSQNVNNNPVISVQPAPVTVQQAPATPQQSTVVPMITSTTSGDRGSLDLSRF